jgi:hypothetical protein
MRGRGYSWLRSYAGYSGLTLVAFAVFILAHGDWLFGGLAAAIGAVLILRARRASL